MRIVIALGGNALLPKGAKGTAEEQLDAAKKVVKKLEPILKANQVVLTHGNGPQVGNLLIQQQATKEVSPMPLDVLDAMTQGQIGYFIASAISMTGLHSATLITRVVVDPDDPAFQNPSKPIGPFYDEPVRPGMKMDANRGYRLFVASPEPVKIREHDAIDSLLERNFVVIAVGGGGIPIKKTGEGLEAVIDKDRATSLLASQVSADLLVFVTSVDFVYVNFGKNNEKKLSSIAIKEAKNYLEAKEFAEGSMKPKIEAALHFIENTGKKVIICSIDNVDRALQEKAGTVLHV
ncbi:Carbamate kinase [Candidatus Bilamarchaeum dharawalense]|uniref:Carbamate kinase n=1 Tax=Candidatus Bilamarchaeum dharawalense TaxID=2885759 RepID=A0A5E4LPX2_9ARCH|nr:Carbamate kinase [Candidatus Bilamarchaeum dharawalense]